MPRRFRGLLSPAMVSIALVCSSAAVTFLRPGNGMAQGSPPKPGPDSLHVLNDAFQSLTRKVSPAVVQIQVTSYGPVRGGTEGVAAFIGRQHVTGSGVILDPDGYIITNAHVLAGAQRVRVVLSSVSGGSPNAVLTSFTRVLDAKIVGQDQDMDLALLKIDATGLPTLPLGDYDKLRQGQVVLAFGSPEGLENSVTMGVISSVARQANPSRPMTYVQTDAPINPGNSGGPLVDVDGRVVGINTFIMTQGGGSEGLGFAIPCAVVKFAYPQLKEHGHVHRGHIGAAVQSITPDMAAALELPQDHGVVVVDLAPGGPAESAGLKIQDVVVALDGQPIVTFAQFQTYLILRTLGESITVDILRGSEKLTLQIPVVLQKNNLDRMLDLVDAGKNMIPKLGILGLQIDEKIAQVIPGIRVDSGVLVAALTANQGSQETGLRPNDIIHSFNRIPILTVEALRSALDGVKPGSPVVLQVEREGELEYATFEME
jgi:serine protease Do